MQGERVFCSQRKVATMLSAAPIRSRASY